MTRHPLRALQRALVAQGLRLAFPGEWGGSWVEYRGGRYRVVPLERP